MSAADTWESRLHIAPHKNRDHLKNVSKIRLPKNRVVAWFNEQQERFSGIYVPEEAQYPISVATVILSSHPSYEPGDKVLAPFDYGKKIMDFDAGGLEMDGISATYGAAIMEYVDERGAVQQKVVEVEMSSQLSAKIKDGIQPVDDQMLILRDPLPEDENGILLLQKSKERRCTGRILEVGSKVQEVSPGDKVVYFSAGIKWIDMESDEELRTIVMTKYGLTRQEVKDLALISEGDVAMIYED